MKRRLLAIVLSVIMVLSLLPVIPFTASAETSGYYTYSVSGSNATITKCDTSISGNVTIPSTLGGYTVTSIGSSAFQNCSKLTGITIPNSVTSIGEAAFKGCSGLTSISLPFVGKSATTSSGYQYVFGYIFGYTTKYNSSKYQSNSSTAFINQNVSTTPSGTTWQYSCYNYRYSSSTYHLQSYYYYIPTSLKSVTITGNSSISAYAFNNWSDLTSITIGDSVAGIGDYAFNNCTGLTSITIPNSVKSIGVSAFSGCSSLTNAPIGNSVTSIGSFAFQNCSKLTGITVPNSVTSIGDSAFKGCSGLTSISLPFVGRSATTSSGYKYQYVFGYIFGYTTKYNSSKYQSNSSTVFVNQNASTTPNGTTWQYSCYDYYNSSLGEYYLQSYYYYIPTSLKSVTITGSSSIPAYAFNNWSDLTSITIGYSVAGIGDYAFNNCTGLTSITIPNSVKSIGVSAFSGCSRLTSISLPFVGDKQHTSSNPYYQYPFGYIFGTSSYEGATSTRQYYYGSSISSATSSIYYIPTSLVTVTITGSSCIPYGAFYNCTSLTSITIPNSVTSIGDSAFRYCTGLTSITIGDSVAGIGDYAFNNCIGLTSITIPNSVTSIGASALYGTPAYNDKSNWDNDVLYIDNCLIFAKTDIQGSLIVKSGTRIIANNAFYGCSMLTNITIPNSVANIGNSAFGSCSKLLYCKFMGNAPTLGSNAFDSGVILAHYKGKTGWTHPTYAGYTCRYIDISNESDVRQLDNDNKNSQGLLFILNEDGSATVGDDTTVDNNSLLNDYTNITIPEYVIKDGKQYPVTTIGHKAFAGYKYLETISIPKSVRTIEKDAFDNCPVLNNISVDSQNTSYSADEYGVLFNRNKTQLVKYPGGSDNKSYVVPETVVSILEGAFGGTQNLEELTIPFVGGYSSSSASKASLFGYIFGTTSYTGSAATKQYYSSSDYVTYYIPTSLKKVNVTKGKVQRGAFYACNNIEEINLGDKVTFIGDSALSGCSTLSKLTLPFVGESATTYSTCKSVFGYIFGYTTKYKSSQYKSYSSTTFVDEIASGIPSNTTWQYSCYNYYVSSGEYALQSYYYYIPSALKEVTILSAGLNQNAFYGCSNIQKINAPYLTFVSSRTFKNCSSLSEINTTAGIENIPDYAFYGCTALKSLKVKDTSTTIGEYALYECSSLTDFSIPSMCTGIGKYALYNCKKLESIRIPLQVTTINEYTFSGCSSVKEVTIPSKVKSIGASAFSDCLALEKINYKAASCSNLSSSSNAFSNAGSNAEELEINIGSGVTSIPAYLFYNVSEATSVKFDPACQCTSIGAYAFYGLSKPESVNIPYTVKTISESAFYGWAALKELQLPIMLNKIGATAFKNCSSITELTIPEGVTSVSLGAFEGCSSLTELTIPKIYNSTIGYIFGASSYSNHSSYVPKSLKKVTISGEITSIGYNAFYGCSNIESISYPDSVTYIGSSAFYNCSSLKEISISDVVTSLGGNAYYGCTELTKIYMGKNVTSLSAFDLPSYTKLKFIDVSEENNSYSSDKSGVLFNKNKTQIICYPQARTYPYYNIPETVTKIPSNAFISNNTYLKQVLIPATVTSIASGNLLKCSKFLLYSDSAALTYAIENNISFEIIDSMTLLGISVQSAPNNVTVVKNCPLDTTGIYVVGNYDIGDMQLDDYSLSYDNTTAGKKTATVSYGGFSDTFSINVVEPEIYAIKVKEVNKTEYIEGEEFDLDGFIISAIWTDGSETNIPNDKVQVQFDSSTPGYTIAVIIFTQNETPYYALMPCIVKPKTATGITVDTDNTKLVYEYGDTFKFSDAVVCVVYDSGLSDTVDEYIISGYNMNKLGKQELTVEYGNFKTTYEITVEKKSVSAPDTAPQIIDITDSAITVKQNDLYEYSVDGVNWQSENVLKNLQFHTEYTVYQRFKETDTTKPSPASAGTTATTKYSLNGYVSVKGRLIAGESLMANTDTVTPAGAEFEYVWMRDGVKINGANSKTYVVTQQDIDSVLSVTLTGKGDYYGTLIGNAPPKTPVLSKVTYSSIMLTSIAGMEYSIDGANWQESATFENLAPDTTYSLYQRVAETSTESSSEKSEALTVKTEKAIISGNISVSGIALVGNTLNVDISGILPIDATLSYQWYRDSVAIVGANNSTYMIGTEDENKQLSVTVSGTDAYIGSLSSDSLTVIVPVSGISLNETSVKIKTGETITLISTILPLNATNKNVVWSTSRKGFASVENGVVTGLKKGTETVTVTTVDGEFTASCVVTVECSHRNTHTVSAETSTCQTHGHDAYTICDECGEIIEGSNAELPYSEHQMDTNDNWKSDDTAHYHICITCGEKLDEAEHTVSDWIIDRESSMQLTGEKHKECTVCGKILETEIIPKLYTPGDINGDGKVNNKDLTRLFQYLSVWDVEVNEAALDVNGDGKVNNKDLTRLFQYLSNWDVEIF